MNVILITVDSLRFDDFMRFARRTLALVKDGGALFTNAVAPGPSTSSSMAAMLTSEPPLEHGSYFSLSPRRTSIAEVFAMHGYACVCLQTNYFLRSKFGWAKGFHIYEELFPESKHTMKKIVEKLVKSGFLKPALRIMVSAGLVGLDKPICRADVLFNRALALIARFKRPMFLWMHLMDVHAPFVPSDRAIAKVFSSKVSRADVLSSNLRWIYEPERLKEDDIRLLRSLYRAEIVSLDEKLSEFINRLLELLDPQDICMAITADHGEEFWDHGGHDHEAKLYDELIHIPLLLICPGLSETKIIKAPVSLMDLPPTLISLALGSGAISPRWWGIDLSPALAGKALSPRRGVLSEVAHREPWKIDLGCLKVSARSGRWKVIYDAEKRGYEVYDLASDPHERRNIALLAPQDPELKALFSMVRKRVLVLRLRFRIRKRFKRVRDAQRNEG